MYQQSVISLFTKWTLNLLLTPRPFMIFDIDAWLLTQKLECKLHKSKVISLITCLSNWGRRYLIAKGKRKEATFVLQNDYSKLYRLKTKCICWRFNDLLQETKCYGKYGLKRHYPFLLVNLIVSVEWVKVGSKPWRKKYSA